jgi:hypothetical protein
MGVVRCRRAASRVDAGGTHDAGPFGERGDDG